jgi:hypothetical protein
MDDRNLDGPFCSTPATSNRRSVLQRIAGLGMGAFAVALIAPTDAVAARRGYSGPTIAGGAYLIWVTEGAFPGEIQTGIMRGAGSSGAITFYNGLSSDLEIEVVPPESGTVSDTLQSGWSLRVPIHHPGAVHWRVWRSGDEPGEFRILDFPG